MKVINSMIETDVSLRLNTASKMLLRVAPAEWYQPDLLQGRWTQSGQIMLFECYNRVEHLKVVLYIAPGPEELRQKLFTMVQENTPVFKLQSKSLNQKWNSIYSKKLLLEKDYEEAEDEDLQIKIETVCQQFVQSDLPRIVEVVRKTIFCSS